MAGDNHNSNSASLGEYLRQERERRGITIEQVASATKISVRLLHSLEADHYADLPAKPFIRGFVTSYLRFIGLDPKEVLTRFGDFLDMKALDRPSREGGHSGYAFEKREGGEQSRTILWIVMGTFIVLGGLAIILLKPALKHHKRGHVEKLRAGRPVPSASPSMTAPSPGVSPAVVVPGASPSVAASPSPGISPQPSPSPSPSPSPVASPSPRPSPTPSPAASVAAPVVVTPSPSPSPSPSAKADPLNSGVDLEADEIQQKAIFKALADVWVRYRVDAKPMMRFILRKDKVLVLRAKSEIVLQMSNPKSLTFNYRGQGAKVAASEKNLATRQGSATLFFPAELAKKIQDPFPGEAALPETPEPTSSDASSPSTSD